ncbi:hypothetical protein VO63_29955 [Streptomyces showdoensis]|uniref:Uncharacterized protein n=1 Tax=Streptomyces showdoensis TaxID=68268 RepID=A0A2P2GFF8_STREW|nr:hypothetical protein VO63_29955 [Streptomyces showdoensis]
MPGAAKSSIRPRWVATGPEPGPSAQSRSSIRRPKIGSTFTTSKAVPQGSTAGAQGRSSQSSSRDRGPATAEASQAAPSSVTRAAWCRPSSRSRRARRISYGVVSSRSHVVIRKVYRA